MIEKAALLLFRNSGQDKQLMFVRSRHSTFLLLPGGKQEPHETVEQALQREITEELSCRIKKFSYLEKVTGFTPDNIPLAISLFTGNLEGAPKASGEIEEIVWIEQRNIADFKDSLTPITVNEIFPCLARYNLF